MTELLFDEVNKYLHLTLRTIAHPSGKQFYLHFLFKRDKIISLARFVGQVVILNSKFCWHSYRVNRKAM